MRAHTRDMTDSTPTPSTDRTERDMTTATTIAGYWHGASDAIIGTCERYDRSDPSAYVVAYFRGYDARVAWGSAVAGRCEECDTYDSTYRLHHDGRDVGTVCGWCDHVTPNEESER